MMVNEPEPKPVLGLSFVSVFVLSQMLVIVGYERLAVYVNVMQRHQRLIFAI